ncbi:MAG: PD-(D/E)XK nuclease-like domain-containing protein [Nocardiaceae bacterium]|nr:PD-(D/E)XK nuclease-like domain-containing protein [Nocardiaceae bacterium]
MIGLPQGIYDSLSDDEYHGDAESLSSSGARKLLECPAKFDHDRRSGQKNSDAFDLGKAFHTKTLGVGQPLMPVDAKDWRTKAAQQAREDIRAAGGIPLLDADHDRVMSMFLSVKAHPDAAALFRDGIPERSLFWHDQEHGVMLRARPDWTIETPNGLVLVDLKSTADANPANFGSSAAKWQYSFQEAFYRLVHERLGLKVAAFLFVCTEKEPPFLTSVVRIDAADIGREYPRITRACELYAEGTRTGNWPGYPAGINDITLPAWYRAQIEKEAAHV